MNVPGSELLTLEEFARAEGWKPAFVQRLRAANRLVLSADGRVDAAASRERIDATRAPEARAEAIAGITEPVGVRDFAHIIGCKPSYVTKLKQADRLVLTDDGKRIHVAASLDRIEDTRSPEQQPVADYWHAHRQQRAAGAAEPEGDDDADYSGEPEGRPAAGPLGHVSYNDARSLREQYQALTAKADYEARMGQLCAVEDVRRAASDIGATIRTEHETLADRLAPELAGEATTEGCYAILSEAFEQTLGDISRMLERLATDPKARGGDDAG